MDTVLKIFPFLLSTLTLHGQEALAYAWKAHDLIGPETWSMVVQIENTAPQSKYPPVVYALVFEVEGILWFYTAADGTQSLSLYQGRAEQDKNDISLLLLAIERGFAHWQRLKREETFPSVSERIPNGCFIESLALLRRRLESGAPAPEARLLSYYYLHTDGHVQGHTVLIYRQGKRVCILDPEKPTQSIQMRGDRLYKPESIADRLHPCVVSSPRVRLIPLKTFGVGRSIYAMKSTRGAEAGALQ